MAGDWIKVEIATSRKAEVLRMAEMLCISRRECMGLLVDYWSWLDVNARTEFVPNLSRKSLDDVLNCPGISACLEAVGWASWSDDGWTMRVSNYDNHNSASAKTRAYEQKKKRGQRENAGTKPGPEKEKRRTISTNVDIEALAKSHGVDCEMERQKYKDYMKAKGRRHKDEDAGFRNWLRKAMEFKPKASVADLKAAVNADIWGKREPSNRDITGESERVA